MIMRNRQKNNVNETIQNLIRSDPTCRYVFLHDEGLVLQKRVFKCTEYDENYKAVFETEYLVTTRQFPFDAVPPDIFDEVERAMEK